MIKFIKNIYAKLTSKKIHKSRKVQKAKFMYYYVIFGSIAGLLYFVSSLVFKIIGVMDLHWHWSFTPIYLLVIWYVSWVLKKNRKLIWLYISNVHQGKLLMYLNEYTHFSDEHKMKLLNWVYLKIGTVRLETYNAILERIHEGKSATEEEKKLLISSVICLSFFMSYLR